MNGKYELKFGYLHCVGKTSYSAGFVDSEKEAENWVEKNRNPDGKKIRPPEEDPTRWCPVKHCHLKRQRPWLSYRRVGGEC